MRALTKALLSGALLLPLAACVPEPDVTGPQPGVTTPDDGASDAVPGGTGAGEVVDPPEAPEQPAAPTADPTAPPAPGTAPAAPTSRDPFLWPFAPESPWNMPLGSEAEYVPVSIGSRQTGIDRVYAYRVSETDPVVPTYDIGAFVGSRCDGTKPQPQGQWHPDMETMRVPRTALMPDANPVPGPGYSTPNSKAAFLMPDGVTLEQYGTTCRLDPEGPLWGYRFPRTTIDAVDPCCGHGGSGLSTLGGTLRAGEVTGTEPIRHKIAINLWGQYLNFDGERGYVWPATNHDGYAPSGGYRGTDPNLRMGTTLAIPPGVSCDSLGLQTGAAQQLCRAMQDYGAIVVDDTGQDTHDLNMEASAEAEFLEQVTGGVPPNQFQPWVDDLNAIVSRLNAVTNLGPDNRSGGGTLRAPLAPALPPM